MTVTPNLDEKMEVINFIEMKMENPLHLKT